MSNKSRTSAIGGWQQIFRDPPILEGEDAAAYDELCGRMYAAVKPADVIDEIYLAGAALDEWDAERWRRFKFTVLQGLRVKGVRSFLEHIDYSLYRKKYETDLADILESTLELAAEQSQELARQCAQWNWDAIAKANRILSDNEGGTQKRLWTGQRLIRWTRSFENTHGVSQAP